ncbi:hypothetical protein BJ508DRAFT_307568 [Ascobolus immersus RN42]|uniref:Uncharacterized protein n=1 Tax=Ascobolus immersus RN42 TaxID=1160509 RepID=A0A3N4I4G8_ASCIM|nr:hypothetical protein BJ508DRAFT_307568 [Ascobolus immersus RN42]
MATGTSTDAAAASITSNNGPPTNSLENQNSTISILRPERLKEIRTDTERALELLYDVMTNVEDLIKDDEYAKEHPVSGSAEVKIERLTEDNWKLLEELEFTKQNYQAISKQFQTTQYNLTEAQSTIQAQARELTATQIWGKERDSQLQETRKTLQTIHDDYRQSRQVIDGLVKHGNGTNMELEALRKDYKLLSGKIVEYQNDHATKDRRIKELEAKASDTEKIVSKQMVDLATKDEEINELEAKAKDSVARISGLHQDIRKKDERIEEMKQQAITAASSISSLEQDKSRQESIIREMEERAHDAASEISGLRTQIETNETTISGHLLQITGNATTIEEMELRLASDSQRIEALEKDLKAMKSEAAKNERARSNKLKQLTKVNLDLKNSRELVGSLEKKLEAKSTEVAKLRECFSNCLGKTKEKDEEIQLKNKQIALLEAGSPGAIEAYMAVESVAEELIDALQDLLEDVPLAQNEIRKKIESKIDFVRKIQTGVFGN